MNEDPLLREKLTRCDPVLMTVQALGQQQYVGVVEKVYSRRFEGPSAYDSGPLHFVGSTGSWGNQTLANGERALVFLSYLHHSSRYYQSHWQGHFSVLAKEGNLLAVANWRLLDASARPWGPAYLRDSAFLLDEEQAWRVAMPFSLLERHLIEEIELSGY